MVEIFSFVIVNVLTTLYQAFVFSILLSMLAMYFYLFATDQESAGQGIKKSMYILAFRFYSSTKFRRLFFLFFYTSLILFRTLLYRDIMANPLSDVMGGWWIYETNPSTGEVKLTTECIENLMLFTPFSVLLMWFTGQKKFKYILWLSTKAVFLFSMSIELLQLFLHLGTFQLSDLFYNTLGGFIGGVDYWIFYKLRKTM
ncbi:TPA: VanZ family protein [Enterococcus faecium]|uniref:VanZ family protein n=1 Tax=Enterococcus TaxID=1350 RepID=UPI000DEBF46A|nr:VanZ family protein [Enterococcus faecium]MBD9749134.1 VanZ family protein [Enterococcus faecium]MCH3236893.1 VanZ family protein [Enterococcus faecium]MCZ1310293.1 VanZ family protein [Enterococcus faecium]MCZ1359044.1 VanZ family protein [Enterococcus faecium]NMO48152.1 VanZ family protein [Enterococcus faecium]